MKTTVIGSGKTTAKTATGNTGATATAKAENGNASKKVRGLPISREFDGTAKDEAKKAEASAQTEQSKPQEKATTAEPKSEPAKAEVKEQAKEKPILNLESTLKLVEELHRRKIQRDKLLNTIDTLESFEVAQLDDAEETDSNHFQGCELTIEDDDRRTFVTKNPYIIQKVAEYINALCLDRLAEIEGEIIIPS